MTELTPTETEVRAPRDNIYGPTTEPGWNGCNHNWLKPAEVQWLKDNQPTKGNMSEIDDRFVTENMNKMTCDAAERVLTAYVFGSALRAALQGAMLPVKECRECPSAVEDITRLRKRAEDAEQACEMMNKRVDALALANHELQARCYRADSQLESVASEKLHAWRVPSMGDLLLCPRLGSNLWTFVKPNIEWLGENAGKFGVMIFNPVTKEHTVALLEEVVPAGKEQPKEERVVG